MTWLVLTAAVLMVWLWWDGLGAKEVARNEAKRLCQQSGVQFLDDTVVVKRMRLCRHRSGRLGLYRRFHFEFASDGEQRYPGYVDMLGDSVLASEMSPFRIS